MRPAALVTFYIPNNFNSRTHVECDALPSPHPNIYAISTHALTWSATRWRTRRKQTQGISTHALTWSATYGFTAVIEKKSFQLTHSRGVRQGGRRRNKSGGRFQLTHSRGVRRSINHLPPQPKKISTHALTWSATTWIWNRQKQQKISTHALTWSATHEQHRR